MGSSQYLDSNSSEITMNPEEQSGFDAAPDSQTDPAHDNSSEEYTDSDDDPNPGIAVGGCYVLDLENGDPDIVKNARAGVHVAIDYFNHRHGASYKLVEIQKVVKSVCMGYAFDLFFAAKPADSVDNLLTEFEAFVWFVPPFYKGESVRCEANFTKQVKSGVCLKLESVRCEAKSTKRAPEATDDSDSHSHSKRQRGMTGSSQPSSESLN